MNRDRLQALIRSSLRKQGFRIRGERIIPPDLAVKEKVRELHSTAVHTGWSGQEMAYFVTKLAS